MPTIADFAWMMIEGMTKAGDHSEKRFDPDAAAILKTEGGQPAGTVNLPNRYATYLAKPRNERADYLRICVRTALSQEKPLPDDFEAARPDLRVKIYSRAAFGFLRLRSQIDGAFNGPFPLSVPVGGHLVAIPAYDWPESTQAVSAENLERWGVTIDEALSAGKTNLTTTMQICSEDRRSPDFLHLRRQLRRSSGLAHRRDPANGAERETGRHGP